VDRMASAAAATSSDPHLAKRKSVFAQTFRQVRHAPALALRPMKPRGSNAFVGLDVVFRGEHAVGKEGPYRQLFMDICHELMDEELMGLLMKVPNAETATGENRGVYIPVPRARGLDLLALFEHIGRLFGLAMRTGVLIPLSLPAVFWKPLVGEALTLNDLKAVDQHCKQWLEATYTRVEFECCDFHYATALSDKTVVEFVQAGSSVPVPFEDRHTFFNRVISCRLSEALAQVQAIRRGLCDVVPAKLLHLFPWEALAKGVCGNAVIDLDLLQAHTRYNGVDPQAPHVGHFWGCMRGLTQAQLARFVRFAYAQERLPTSEDDYRRTRTTMTIKGSTREGNPDDQLPHADTCFFNVELPAYSTLGVMRARLLAVINTDVDAMDADEDMDDLAQGTGVQSESGSEFEF